MNLLKLKNTTVDEFSSLLSHPLFPLVCLDQRTYQDYRDLDGAELERVQLLWKELNQKRRRGSLSITFRGDKKDALRDRYFHSEYGDISQSKLASSIFYFGDKARHYFNTERKTRGRLFEDINDASKSAFGIIFDELNRISSANYSSPRISEALQDFSQENPDFVNYFQNQVNRDDFINLAVATKDAEQVRNYYLYLLHTFGGKRISKSSLFISTSGDPGLARQFAISDRKEPVNSRSIIFVCFLPREVRRHGVSISVVQKLLSGYRKAGLPTYSTDLYKQDEISIKGGLFPQYLFGFFDLENYCFVVNPYMFDDPASAKDIAENGLKIDQSDFHSRIRDTAFQRYLWAIEDDFGEYSVQ